MVGGRGRKVQGRKKPKVNRCRLIFRTSKDAFARFFLRGRVDESEECVRSVLGVLSIVFEGFPLFFWHDVHFL